MNFGEKTAGLDWKKTRFLHNLGDFAAKGCVWKRSLERLRIEKGF
jgi:hypothetical protein